MSDMQDYYNGISQGYDELYKEEQLDKLNFIKNNFDSKFKISLDDSLLDVGCGTGVSTDFFKCVVKKGFDPASKMIDVAISNYDDCEFKVGFVEEIPFSEKFDVVISLTAAQNFSDVSKGFLEIRRVCNDRLIVTFLKNSSKKDEIINAITENFNVYRTLEHSKDLVVFAKIKI